MSGTSSDDGEAWSHAHHLIYYVGMRYRSVVICKDFPNGSKTPERVLLGPAALSVFFFISDALFKILVSRLLLIAA